MELVRPRALRSGDQVALIAPAGPPDRERTQAGIRLLEGWGLEPRIAPHAFGDAPHGFLAAPDEYRLADLVTAWDDPAVAGVLALRGGYGVQRIIDDLDLRILTDQPKVFCGFSDCTALHLALQRAGIVSIHGPNIAADPQRLGPSAESWLRRVLTTTVPLGELPARGESLVGGRAEGPLLGGNITLLCTSVGTPHHPVFTGAVALLEDVGERPYALDRALHHLRRAGVLAGIAGLVLDTLHACVEDRPGRRSATAVQVLTEHAQALGVPAVCGLPIGHGPGQLAVPLGVRCRLDADAGTLTFLEPALS